MAAPPPTLKHRRDFLACARARRWAAPGLILQARRRAEAEGGGAETIRVGYTCSKKLGGAVARNRAKRRLREVFRHQQQLVPADYDLLMVARHSLNGLDYTAIEKKFIDACRRLFPSRS